MANVKEIWHVMDQIRMLERGEVFFVNIDVIVEYEDPEREAMRVMAGCRPSETLEQILDIHCHDLCNYYIDQITRTIKFIRK